MIQMRKNTLKLNKIRIKNLKEVKAILILEVKGKRIGYLIQVWMKVKVQKN